MKFFRKIHLWLSVPFGLIITLICFSGAMLVFEPEITRAVRSDVYYVAASGERPLPMAELMETVSASLPDSVSITGVTVFSDNNRTYQVGLSKPRRASVFVDQYSGEITGRYERTAFFSTMFKLHRWLLDGADPQADGLKTGKLLVGVSTLLFVIVLISGVVIWVPRARRKGLWKTLVIPVSDGWKGFWKGLHVAGGMYALVFVLAMALTGLTWSFNWYRTAFYAVCGVEPAPRSLSSDAESRGRSHSEFARWQQVYDELRKANPGAPQITVGPETASVTIGDAGNIRAANTYVFNSLSGEVVPRTLYADAQPADKLRGWIYSIHTGSLGGILTRILWLLGALLGATLPLTGYYIWIRHLLKKKHGVAHRASGPQMSSEAG